MNHHELVHQTNHKKIDSLHTILLVVLSNHHENFSKKVLVFYRGNQVKYSSYLAVLNLKF